MIMASRISILWTKGQHDSPYTRICICISMKLPAIDPGVIGALVWWILKRTRASTGPCSALLVPADRRVSLTHGLAPIQQTPACLSTVVLSSVPKRPSPKPQAAAAAGKSPTVLACNYRTTGGKKITLSVTRHFIPLRLRLHVPWYILFQNLKGAYLSVRVAFTTRMFSDHLRMTVLSREAINNAFSDHTKMGVVIPDTWLLEQGSSPIPATVVAFPGTLARACLGH